MGAKVIRAGTAVRGVLHGAPDVEFLSRPDLTGTTQLLMLRSTLSPGYFHTFHKHLRQEEILLVESGRVEQWTDEEVTELGPGDSVFIPAGVVHAAVNLFDEAAVVIAVTSPCFGATGHEMVDVGAEEPWASRLRELGRRAEGRQASHDVAQKR